MQIITGSVKQWISRLHSFKTKKLKGILYLCETTGRGKKEGIVWKLNEEAYGLCDASRQWYFNVKEELCKFGCRQSQLHKALFRWYASGILKAYLSCMLMIFYMLGLRTLRQ